MIVRPLTASQRAGLRSFCWTPCPRCHGTGVKRAAVVKGKTLAVRELPCDRCGGCGRERVRS